MDDQSTRTALLAGLDQKACQALARYNDAGLEKNATKLRESMQEAGL